MPDEDGSGSSPFMPRSPDPTAASKAAFEAAADMSHREIGQLRELHDKDLAAFRELLEARLGGMDQDRRRLWERSDDLVKRFTDALSEFRNEVERRDQANRQLIEQRLEDLDRATTLSRTQIKEESSLRDQDISDLRAAVEHRGRACDMDRAKALASTREIIEQRLSGMDRAAELLAADLRQVPTVLQSNITGLRELMESKLAGMSEAVVLQNKQSALFPVEIRTEITHLQQLHEEKFASIGQQFSERDIRTSEAAKSAKDALDAALQAAKELVNAQGEASSAAAVKSETSFTKQIDQIGTIISTLEKALDARITELKERIDRGEGTSAGASTATDTSRYDAQFEQTSRLAAAANLRTQVATAVAAIAILVSVIVGIALVLKK